MTNMTANESFLSGLILELETCLNHRHGTLHVKEAKTKLPTGCISRPGFSKAWLELVARKLKRNDKQAAFRDLVFSSVAGACSSDPNIENGNPGLLLSSIVFQGLGDNNGQGTLSFRQKAEFRQWIEFISIYGHLLQSNSTSHPILRELNSALAMKSFLTSSCEPNVIDAVFYGLLHKVMANITYQEKEQYVNLSRWFNTVQQDSKIRRNRKVINFSRSCLYS